MRALVHPSRFAGLCAALVGAMTVARGVPPSIGSVDPAHGWPDQPTPIAVAGEGFAQDDLLRLAAGGPRLAGRLETTGRTIDVAVENGIACLAEEFDGLRIVDVRNPAAPRTLATALIGTPVDRVVMSGGVAFLAADSLGVFAVDVSRPESPVVLGSLAGLLASALALDERYLYVASGMRGLVVLDRADPAALRIVGEVPTGGYAADLAVSGSRAVVVVDQGGVVSIALDDPSAPRILGTAPVEYPECVEFVGRHAVVSTAWDGLIVFDVAGPRDPRVVGRMPFGDGGFAIAARGRFALVSSYDRGLEIADLSDPARPRPAASGPSGTGRGIAVDGALAFVATGSGLDVIDVTQPASPAPKSTFAVWSEKVLPVVPAGPVAYVGTDAGLIVLDVTDPAAPQALGELDGLDSVSGLAARPGRAFLISSYGDLWVADLGEPHAPRTIGATVMPGFRFARTIAAAEPWVYVARSSALGVVDASDPTAPRFVGSTALPSGGSAWDVAVDGQLVFVAALQGGLIVLDRQNPAEPRFLGSAPPRQWAVAVAVAGQHAFVADWDAGLSVYDVSVPASPRLVGQAATLGKAWDVVVEGSTVLVADEGAGLLVFDVRDPTRPVLIERRWTYGACHAISAADGLAFSRDERLGVDLIHLTPPLSDAVVASSTEIRATVPPGLTPGVYDVTLTDRERRLVALPNSFTVCGRESLRAVLRPSDGTAPPRSPRDAPWRLEVEAAAAASARLVLPPLPAPAVETRFERDPAAAPDSNVVDLHVWPDLGTVVVVLRGADEAAARALWSSALETGGFPLPRLDERSFGDVRLTLGVRPPAATAIVEPLAGSAVGRVVSPVLTRIELVAGLVAAARAWGPGTDLVFEAFPAASDRCLTPSTTSFAEALLEACLALAGEHPDLELDCAR
jgi:hypothetical protein